MSFIHWASIAKRHFVSSAKGFSDLKTEFFFICFIFPPLAFLSWCIISLLSFLVRFSFRFNFSVALDPSNSLFRNFFVGVCHIDESKGRAVHFGDLIPVDCVLHRLSEELFALAFLALSTWKTIRGFMASEGNSWPLVRS